MRTFLAPAFAALDALSLSAYAQTPAAKESDPIVGKWRWTDKQVVECKADLTFVASPTKRCGTWKFVPGTTVERKYAFTWDDGLFVDSLMMSRDEKTLKGKNQEGKSISATKIP